MAGEIIDKDVQDAVDERIDWIKQATARGLKHGVIAIRDAIEDLDDEHLRSMLFVLMSHYLAEAEQLQQAIERHQLENLDGETLH